MKLTGMTDTWADKQIKKNELSCVPWFSLRDLVQNHLDILKRIDLFALAIYELIIFLKGGVAYGSLMVQKHFASRQFVPTTGGLAQSEFAFTGEGYMKKVRDTVNSLRELYLMELALYANTITLDYDI
ncbi:hypothetical protein Goklo_029087 [Gossypium klotzschianum]|uniref:Uncharacterized protein n=1 Tax=Gossypium klotzschianum TaxID=34286 RepID=A0A7J8WDD0_9ROSI|nr:hypothetical protein [Gossypium klotzschianum]